MKRIIGWLDSLSSKAILNRLDKRKRVQEQDLRRIHALFSKASGKGDQIMDALDVDELQQVVNEKLGDQIHSFASRLHQFLEKTHDAVPFAKRAPSLPEHVIFPEDMQQDMVQENTFSHDSILLVCDRDMISTFSPKTSLAEVSDMFQARFPAQSAVASMTASAQGQERFGYSLHVSDSSISHPEAGKGLWLSGKASPGSIVGIFPGVTYAPIHYREMIGYPKIDEDNPYLTSRFDGVIVDSKPWGFGLYDEHAFPGTTQTFPEVYELEGRHPLAFAHFANHPPKGTLPNTLLAPFDIRTTVISRPYVPVVKCLGPYAVMETDEVVSGIALVAERTINNEEIFVNYRLNPSVTRPKWYSPVDEKEDILRWT